MVQKGRITGKNNFFPTPSLFFFFGFFKIIDVFFFVYNYTITILQLILYNYIYNLCFYLAVYIKLYMHVFDNTCNYFVFHTTFIHVIILYFYLVVHITINNTCMYLIMHVTILYFMQLYIAISYFYLAILIINNIYMYLVTHVLNYFVFYTTITTIELLQLFLCELLRNFTLIGLSSC